MGIGGNMTSVRRIVFKYEPGPTAPATEWREAIPAGFHIRRMDRTLAEELDRDLVANGNPPWFDAQWGGVDAFLQDGFGFVAIGPEGIAGNCRATSVVDGVAEIQISTRSAYRRTGLGTIVCRAFIDHCIRSGLTPAYACDDDNLASRALARRLGFVPLDSGSSQ
jgi:RimJ/RimL family protein N-acetyltransferase